MLGAKVFFISSRMIKKETGAVPWAVWITLHEFEGRITRRLLAEIVSRKTGRTVSPRRIKSAVLRLSKLKLVNKGKWEGHGNYVYAPLGEKHPLKNGWVFSGERPLPRQTCLTERAYQTVGYGSELVTARGCPIAPPSGRLARARKELWDRVGMGPMVCVFCGKIVTWSTLGPRSWDAIVACRDPDTGTPVPGCRKCARGGGHAERKPLRVDTKKGDFFSGQVAENLSPLIPDFPGMEIFYHENVPVTAPVIDLSSWDDVRLLARIYRGRGLYYFGKEGLSFDVSDGGVQEVCRSLLNDRISVLYWVDFVMKNLSRQHIVTQSFHDVFDKSLLCRIKTKVVEHAERCESDRVVLCSAHSELMARWNDLNKEISSNFFEKARDLTVVVERHFPGGLYDDLVCRAKVQYQKRSKVLQKMLKKGEWIWD